MSLSCRNKVRSIVHCCQLIRERIMNVEQKYDNEYCQIHVRLTRVSFKIQLFFKSDRDFIVDRTNIYEVIVISLVIDTLQYKF